MRRDMDLVRQILLRAEAGEERDGWLDVSIPGRDDREISDHIKLLVNENFLDGRDVSTFNNPEWKAESLTWRGHDFLNAIRNDTVWTRTKGWLAEKGGAASLELVREIATKYGKQLLLGDEP